VAYRLFADKEWSAPDLLDGFACICPRVHSQTAIQQLLVAAGVDPAEEDSDGNVASTMAP